MSKIKSKYNNFKYAAISFLIGAGSGLESILTQNPYSIYGMYVGALAGFGFLIKEVHKRYKDFRSNPWAYNL